MALILEFGTEQQRPAYIGLANSLIAPSAILAPILGGWLADRFNYSSTFLVTAVMGVLTAVIFYGFVRDPRHLALPQPATAEETFEPLYPD